MRDIFKKIILILLFLAVQVNAVIYYIDGTDGSDIAAGSAAAPWKTFTRARPNSGDSPEVVGGDTVKFQGGDYGAVSWGGNLTSSDWITYEVNDVGSRPSLTSFTLSSSTIQNVRIKLKGFDFPFSAGGNAISIDDCNFFAIEDCNIQGDSDWISYDTRGGINCSSGEANRVITNIEVNNCIFNNLTNAIQGTRVGYIGTADSGYYIHDNTITYSAIDAVGISSPQNTRIKDNTIEHTNWYRGRTGGTFNVRIEDANGIASGTFVVGDTLTQGGTTGILVSYQLTGIYAPCFHIQSNTAGWGTNEVTSSSGGTFTPSKSSDLDHHGDVMQLYGAGGDSPSTLNGGIVGLEISGNTIDDFYQGIFLKDFNDVLIENNIIRGWAGSLHVVTLHDDCITGIVRNNTILSGNTGIRIYSNDDGGDHFDIYNNIVRGYIQLATDWGATANIKNNICGFLSTSGGSVTRATNSIFNEYISSAVFETYFVDYPDDLNLIESAYPINFGTSESSPTHDIVGNERDQWPDAGSYEFMGEVVEPDDLLAYWTLDDNTTTPTVTDTTGNGYTGTYTDGAGDANTSTGSVAGKVNTALDFDDDNSEYIIIADAFQLSPLDTFSISAWVYLEDSSNFPIISKGVFNTDAEWLFVVGPPLSFPDVDFTSPAWDEQDAGNDITITATKVAWANYERDDDAHVSDLASQQGTDLTGDFSHQFEVYIDSAGNEFTVIGFWAVGPTTAQTYQEHIDGGEDFVWLKYNNLKFYLEIGENGSIVGNDNGTIAEDTLYFVTVTRDDDGGANNTGRYTVIIRTTSHSGSVVDTLTADCSAGEQNNFTRIYALMGWGGSGTNSSTGYVQNLNLGVTSDTTPKLKFIVFDESVAGCYIGREYTTDMTSKTEIWMHFAATFDGSTTSSGITLYVDGAAVDDADYENNAANFVVLENLTHDVWIGRYDDDYADGRIDDVRFYTVTLTATQVSELAGGSGSYDGIRRNYRRSRY